MGTGLNNKEEATDKMEAGKSIGHEMKKSPYKNADSPTSGAEPHGEAVQLSSMTSANCNRLSSLPLTTGVPTLQILLSQCNDLYHLNDALLTRSKIQKKKESEQNRSEKGKYEELFRLLEVCGI